MDKKCFKLRVKPGTKIISSKEDFTVTSVPDDAFARMIGGSVWLGFTPEAVEELKSLPEERQSFLLKLRQSQGFEDDVKILEMAMKKAPLKPKITKL